MGNLFEYFVNNKSQILSLLVEHIELTFFALLIAVVIGIPLGIFISKSEKIGGIVIGFASVVQAIPSMALLGFIIPFLGIGTKPAIAMVVLYSLLPIIKNTYTGIKNISPQMIETAEGIGLTKGQILFKVQIPQALPVMMAGVRISAVSAVGLMTLSAFVGAGGLGYLVYAGIRSVNNTKILAGAIPACILALIIDYLTSIVENLVVPKNLLPEKKSFFKNPKYQITILVISIIAIFGLIYASNVEKQKQENYITIGSMDFTEQEILSYLVKYMIQDNLDVKVNQKLSLGSSTIVMGAVTSGDIDMYIDYTGTIYGSVLKQEPTSDVNKVYTYSKEKLKEKYDLNMLDDLNFNNTYTLSVRKDTAQKYNLKTISDLVLVASELKFSPTITFMERKDCWLGIQDFYNLQFKDVIPIDGSPRYVALQSYESDVIDAYSTDALLSKYDLVVLEDDKNFFLPYHAVPIVNDEILEKYPTLPNILNELSSVLNDEVMRELNYKVDEEKQNAEIVAKEFLKSHNLID